MNQQCSWPAVVSGFVGALTLTALHQGLKRVTENAPQADRLGREAIGAGIEAAGYGRPSEGNLQKAALAGDLVTNSLYYSAVGLVEPRNAPATGAFIGLAAGMGALALPGPLGLDSSTTNRTLQTQIMTVAVYLAGGVAAGLICREICGRD